LGNLLSERCFVLPYTFAHAGGVSGQLFSVAWAVAIFLEILAAESVGKLISMQRRAATKAHNKPNVTGGSIMLRSRSKSVSHAAAHSPVRQYTKVKVGERVRGRDGNFGTVLELMGDHALCLFDPPCKRIKLKKPLSLTQPQLERLNNESIRLGFSANIWENKVAALPRDQRFKIVKVFQHKDGHSNIRLDLFIGPNKDNLYSVWLDVTPDAWAAIQKSR
jgi:hypothetical protein